MSTSDRKRGAPLRATVVTVLLSVAGTVGAGFALWENKGVREWVIGKEVVAVATGLEFDLRHQVLDRRDDAAAEGDLVEVASIHADLAHEAVLRARAVHDAWMARRHGTTFLFPESAQEPRWTYRDVAADFFGFMLHAAMYTDADTLAALRETLAAERALAAPGELCACVSVSNADSLGTSARERLFGSSEYVKDGLLTVYERHGDGEVLARMLEIVDAILAHRGEMTPYGLIPDERSEVNGEMLQVLGRLGLAADRPEYFEAAAILAEAITAQALPANNGLPSHTFDYSGDRTIERTIQLRDHGNEAAVGLSEVYALAVALAEREAAVEGAQDEAGDWAGRAGRWAEPIALMYERILEAGVNDDGLIVNKVNPLSLAPDDARASDNWGYVLTGALLFEQAARRHNALGAETIAPARLDALLTKIDEVAAAVARTNGVRWEGDKFDGYADSIESALHVAAHRPAAAPSLLAWVDRQIGVLYGWQQDDGFVGRYYLDGNFIRTALMYADLRNGGWRVRPWSKDVRIGLAVDGDGRAVLLVEAEADYTGVLQPDAARHETHMRLPWDWPRLNSWPQWLLASDIASIERIEGPGSLTNITLADLHAAEEGTGGGAGVPIALRAGERLILHLQLNDARSRGETLAPRAPAPEPSLAQRLPE